MVKPRNAIYATVGGVSTALVAANALYPNLWRDVKVMGKQIGPVSRIIRYVMAQPPVTLVDRFLHQVQVQPDKPFLLFEDQLYTYKDMDVMSNKVANFFHGEGYKCGDTVAMLIYNEPAFIWTCLGLAKLGVKTALLNTNLKSMSLLHCFKVAEAKALILGQGDALLEVVVQIQEELQQLDVTVWLQGDVPPPNGILSLDDKISGSSDQPIPLQLRESIHKDDTQCYIYTSGTTGLPKAAVVSYEKMIGFMCITGISGVRADDVVYVTVPLYHGLGFGVGLGGTIEYGMTMALAAKFSARRFWDDCRKFNVTVMLYIGELIRYLCSQPKTPYDRNNKVRLATGNGLRADVWAHFQGRFGVKDIVECYGSIEGNMAIVNQTNKIGSVGLLSPLLTAFQQVALLKIDPDTYRPVRDEKGRCVRVKKGEPGLLICPISWKTAFLGYKGNKQQTESKILRDVFKEGDMFLNTGDLLTLDKDNYFYFVDRVGDTFRWKGENVSTTEVAEVLHEMQGVQEANVYGVKLPGHEGRVGMAAILLHPGHQADLQAWYSHVTTHLPSYGRPLVLRLTNEIKHTSTFKQIKTQLVKEGFNPEIIFDPLYYRDDSKRAYVPLDRDAYKMITTGKAKL